MTTLIKDFEQNPVFVDRNDGSSAILDLSSILKNIDLRVDLVVEAAKIMDESYQKYYTDIPNRVKKKRIDGTVYLLLGHIAVVKDGKSTVLLQFSSDEVSPNQFEFYLHRIYEYGSR